MSASAHATYRISVWQPRTEVARDRVRQHAGIITETNPVFYTMTTNGALVESSKAYNTTWTSALAGTEVLPTFQNTVDYTYWGGAEVANYVIHPNYREAYTNQIRDKVVARGWAGADIDYEEVPVASKDDFTAFIAMLAEKLHAVNKKLSVCVYGKRNDTMDPGWPYPAGQDWAALAQHADYIKIMIYGSHSTQKPNSTFTYINDVLNYAKTKITDHKKIIVGMPWYVQEYMDTNRDGKYEDYDSYGYDQVAAFLAANPTITPTRDTANSGEMNFPYTDSNGTPHWVWYTDGPAWAAKVQYVIKNHPTVGGFAQWSIGEEDPKVWGAVAQLKPRWEYNKDGNHDVIFRSNAGQLAYWNMSSNTVLAGTYGPTDPSFDAVLGGHFLRDGEIDIVMRNHATGEMKIHQMNNHTIAATHTLPTTTDVNWKVVAAADTDSDGRHEIIWHHSNGGVALWRRDLTNGVWYGNMIGTAMATPAWQLAGVGDFNLDGRDDLVWRNQSTGANALWTMDGLTVTNSGALTSMGTAWKLAGVGDFNRDHYPDLLWRNDSTWATEIWQMKDRTVLATGATSSTDPVYQVVRVGDFNGDGYSDILWRHSTAGDIVLWQMTNYSANTLYVLTTGPNWSITAK
ncbi:MAG TPA: FG-GAP-like repeat-containing protein [Thermoanaerobaculia bacterium]